MSFKDENEILSGVQIGYNAFTSVPPKGSGKPAPAKRSHHNPQKRMTKLELSCSVLDSDEEKAAKRKAAAEARRTGFASAKEVANAARGALQSKRVSEQRAKGVEMGTMYGLSRSADEKIREHKAREKKITARKNISTFNVAIATPDDSRKTQSIKGKL